MDPELGNWGTAAAPTIETDELHSNSIGGCTDGHHLLLHGVQSLGGVAVCVVHHLVGAQPSDETLGVVGAGNSHVGAPGFQQLAVDSDKDQAAAQSRGQTHTHTLYPPPLPPPLTLPEWQMFQRLPNLR